MPTQAIPGVYFYVFIGFYVHITLNNKAVWVSYTILNKTNSDVPVLCPISACRSTEKIIMQA